ncbi:MAG: 3-isopropylmalate dehydratase [Clostridia bacterium BRH_c25]|nr:MAG: 3-isopropylmalate dehydratase [Clostridia bacterium BRH_c25]
MIRGKVWKYGKNVDTEEIYPGRYLVHFEPQEVAKHAMEDIDPKFAQRVKAGDIIVAGHNFGCGSAREQAAMTLKYAQVGAIVADSISRAFYRNAVNNGLPVLAMEGISEQVNEGDELEVDLESGVIANLTTGAKWQTKPAPKLILDIISMDGAIAYYKKTLK